MLTKFFAVILIALGTPLEAYYYWYSFTNEGVLFWIAILASFVLIMLLNSAVYLSGKNKRWYILAAVVACFSIISTSAGQDFATGALNTAHRAEEIVRSAAEREVTSTLAEISRLDKEYELLDAELRATITSLEDRYEWKNTSAEVEKQKEEIRKERRSLAEKLADAETTLAAEEAKVKYSLYEYYSKLVRGLLSPETIQFLKHFWLSILLMLTAPTGIKMWEGATREVSPNPKKPSTPLRLPKVVQGLRELVSGKKKAVILRKGKVVVKDQDAWDKLPNPCPLRALAGALNISHAVLYRAVKNGDLPGWGNNPIQAYKEDVDAWIERKQSKGDLDDLETTNT